MASYSLLFHQLKALVVGIVLSGEKGGHPNLLNAGFQRGIFRFQFFQNLRVLRFLPHFAQGGQILPGGDQLLLADDLVLQLLQAHLHLLGPLQVVPEAVLRGLRLQPLRLLPGAFNVQRGGQLVQLGA